MKTHPFRYVVVTGVTALMLLLAGGAAGILAQDTGTVEFANLPDGTVVSSLTTLSGTIDFADFLKYEIFLKAGDSLQWVANSHSPVANGNLARLDPRVFQSGTYQLLVRQVHSDSNYTDVPGPTITIENPNGGPLSYYPEVEPSFLYPSEKFALVRARNCAGEDFFFDYTSPEGSGSAGDMLLPGKSGDTICRFADFTLIPAHYSGTAKGGAQATGAPLEFDARPGKVYQILYMGGGQRITVQEVPPDSKTAEGGSAPAEGEPPAQATATPAPTTAPTAAPAPTATSEPMLPVSGNSPGGVPAFAAISVLLIIVLTGGGWLAARKKPAG